MKNLTLNHLEYRFFLVCFLLFVFSILSLNAQNGNSWEDKTIISSCNDLQSVAMNSTEEVYTIGFDQGNSTAILAKFDGTNWSTVGSFSPANVANFDNFMVRQPELQIDGNGHFHIAFAGWRGSNSTGNRGIWYGYSSTGATNSWTFTEIQTFPPNVDTNSKSIDNHSLVLDAQNRPHIVYSIRTIPSRFNSDPDIRTIRYWNKNSGSWVSQDVHEYTQSATMATIPSLDFAIDKNDKLHVVFAIGTSGDSNAGLWYSHTLSGSWSTITELVAASTNTGPGYGLSLVVDENIKLHVVYGDDEWDGFYGTDESGSFSITSLGGKMGFSPQSLRLTANGDLFTTHRAVEASMFGSLLPSNKVQFTWKTKGQSTWQTGTIYDGGTDAANSTDFGGVMQTDYTVVSAYCAGSIMQSSKSTFTTSSSGGSLDGEPEITIAVTQSPQAENSSTAMIYTFTRTGDTGSALVVKFGVTGTADRTNDFTLSGATTYSTATGLGTVTIPTSSASKTITVIPTGDTTIEPDETVIVTVVVDP